MKLHNFKQFKLILENNVEEYSNEKSYVASKLPELMKLNNFVLYGNFEGLKKPLTDLEVSQNEELLINAVKKYDELFNTHYFEKYGTDYSMLVKDPTIKKLYYGDVVKQLCIDSFKLDIFKNINAENITSINDYILTYIIYKKISKECEELKTKLKSVLFKSIPKVINNKEFLYKFFKNNGTEFTKENIHEIFEIKNKKNHYELGGESAILAHDYIQKLFLSSLKKSVDRFNDLLDTDKLFDLLLKNMDEKIENDSSLTTSIIHDRYIIFRLKEFLHYIKSLIK